MLAVGICCRQFLQLAGTQVPLRYTRPLVSWCVSAVSSAYAADMGDVNDSATEAAVGPRHKHHNKRRRVAPDVPKCSTVSKVEREKYAEQLARKVAKVGELFADFAVPELESFASEPEHHRLRAEFRVWQSGDDIFYVMFEKAAEERQKEGSSSWEKLRIDRFPVASELVNELMAAVIDSIRGEQVLRKKLFQANFHSTLSGEAMVTLIYHKHLDDVWMEAAKKLRAALGAVPHAQGRSVDIIGRSRKQKIALDRDYVVERMPVGNRTFTYQQIEGAFSQPNGGMCGNMLQWAQAVTRGSTGDLLELYCGNGNFTIALAENFREVIATEVSKASVSAAKYNLAANSITNVHIARLSSEEFTQAWRGDREFVRLKDLPPVHGRKFQTILVDPPRAGLDSKTVELLQHFDNVVYISCNPLTLHANLQNISSTHNIERFAVFDQFPYTDHIECGVYLTRKQ